MQVEYQKNSEDTTTADLFVIGVCLGLQVNGDTHRIALNREQWRLLAQIADRRSRIEGK